MILSFTNIRKVSRESENVVFFNTSLGTLGMLINEKSCLVPLFILEIDHIAVELVGNNLQQKDTSQNIW